MIGAVHVANGDFTLVDCDAADGAVAEQEPAFQSVGGVLPGHLCLGRVCRGARRGPRLPQRLRLAGRGSSSSNDSSYHSFPQTGQRGRRGQGNPRPWVDKSAGWTEKSTIRSARLM